MTDLRKAAEITLDALRLYVTMYPQMDKGYMVDARETLRQALAQPEQESPHSATHSADSAEGFGKREWVGLTDEEIKNILDCGRGGLVDIKKAEQILKEKNT